MSNVVAVGIHIGKTAGATFVDHVRLNLAARHYSICSTFIEPTEFQQVQLPELLTLDELRVVFGHYVHESLIPMFYPRDVFLFMGMREPIARAVSEFKHINTVRATWGSQPPLGAAEYLEMRQNTLCKETLRALPRLGDRQGRTLSEAAFEASKWTDYLYSSEDFDNSIAPVLEVAGLPRQFLRRANESASVQSEFVEEQVEELRRSIGTAYDEDRRYYDLARDHIGVFQPFGDVRQGRVEKLRALYPEPADAFRNHLAGFLVAEFAFGGQMDSLKRHLSSREKWIEAIRRNAWGG